MIIRQKKTGYFNIRNRKRNHENQNDFDLHRDYNRMGDKVCVTCDDAASIYLNYYFIPPSLDYDNSCSVFRFYSIQNHQTIIKLTNQNERQSLNCMPLVWIIYAYESKNME